jgi:UTP--glucose-1-phosphate uridylyltransferase
LLSIKTTSMNIVKKAIIPAGGLGSRFLPASAAIPKEIFPVFDKPLIYYAIEELKDAGVEEVYIVVSPWKLPIFESFFNLNERYAGLKADPAKKSVVDKLSFLDTWPKINFVIQTEAKGLAEAIGLCRAEIGEEPFFVILPDEIFVATKDSALNPSQKLLSVFEKFNKSVVGLFQVPISEVSNYGIAKLGLCLGVSTENVMPGDDFSKTYELDSLIEKPRAEESPSQYMLPGRYLFNSCFWTAIEKELSQIGSLKQNQELHITNAMDRLACENLLLGQEVLGQRFDAGRPEGLLALSQFEFSKQY